MRRRARLNAGPPGNAFPLLLALCAAAAGCTSSGRSQSDHPTATGFEQIAEDGFRQREAQLRRLRHASVGQRARRSTLASTTSGGSSTGKTATRTASIFSRADRADFNRLAASLSGQHGLAASTLGFDRRVERIATIRTGVAWSTSKVPVAMAVIAAGGAQAQRQNLTRALTASDNAAALRLWSALGGGQVAARAAEAQVRQAGDRRTRVESRALRGAGFTPFGQTMWALTDQVRFMAGLSCVDAGADVLGLMNRIEAGQRWGLGAAGVDAQFKGGWGPGSYPGVNGGYFDRQIGVIVIKGKPIAVAIATRPGDGSHATGRHNLTTIARWLVAHGNTQAVPAQSRCSD
jgi:hypothetical protein